jgi:hypothetical protein
MKKKRKVYYILIEKKVDRGRENWVCKCMPLK